MKLKKPKPPNPNATKKLRDAADIASRRGELERRRKWETPTLSKTETVARGRHEHEASTRGRRPTAKAGSV
jgi:hypothetical protein